ncbi:MAG: flagellar filament capping protein FliD [Cellulosilyticaceae bacterium]
MRTTNIKFMGLASGLDTESIVNTMLMPYKSKVDGSKQDQLIMEMKKDAWKDINSKIYSFHTKQLDALRLQSTFSKKNVSTSNSGIVEVGSTIELPDGTHQIKVEQLAEGARLETESLKEKYGVDISKSAKLSELGINSDTTIEVKYKKEDGTEVTTPITLTSDMSIGELEKELKTALPDANVNFDEGLDAFFVSSKKTGASQSIDLKVTSGDANALANLGFKTTSDTGNNTIAYYNGVKIDSESNSVKVNGMELKLVSQGETTLVATRDTDAIVDTVVQFVNEYNKLIEDINKLIDAPYNKDYKPLTDEQKKEMSEDEIKLWNEKINNSLLRNDPVLKSITSSMREVLSTTVITDAQGNKVSLSDLGITTGKNWNEKGKLYIDEKKLKEAVSNNPDGVMKLFTQREDPKELYKKDTGLDNYEEAIKADPKLKEQYENLALTKGGIGTRLYGEMNKKLKSTTDKSANFLFNDKVLDKKITEQKEKTKKLEDQMKRMEGLYYKKFTAMEKMMSQLNSQSSWLASQLGGM